MAYVEAGRESDDRYRVQTTTADRRADATKRRGVTETVWLSDCSAPFRRSSSSRSIPAYMKCVADWSLVPAHRMDADMTSSCSQLTDISHIADLQSCMRHAASNLTRLVNAVRETATRVVTVGGVANDGRALALRRRLIADCASVTDAVLPGLVQGIKVTVTRPKSVVAQALLVNAALCSLEPSVQMILELRELMDEIDDVRLVSALTSLALDAASSLLCVRRAARAALRAAAAAGGRHRDVVGLVRALDDEKRAAPGWSGGSVDVGYGYGRRRRRWPEVLGGELMVDGGRRGGTVAAGAWDAGELDVYHVDEASLAAAECCDAAYRQIQGCGSYVDQNRYWQPVDEDGFVQLLTKVVRNCYALGTYITDICRNAKDGLMHEMCQSVTCFAGSVCHIITSVPQISHDPSLVLTTRGVRHCACSLLMSARWLATEYRHSAPYKAYSSHSHALSRALTQLVHSLSTIYLDSETTDLSTGFK